MWILEHAWIIASKTAKTIAYVALVGLLTVALILVFTTALAPLARTMPADSAAFAAALLPSNLKSCVSVIIAAYIARWVYDRNLKIADKLSND